MTMPKGWDGKKMRDDPDSPHMSESTIWSDQVTTGFFRKKSHLNTIYYKSTGFN